MSICKLGSLNIRRYSATCIAHITQISPRGQRRGVENVWQAPSSNQNFSQVSSRAVHGTIHISRRRGEWQFPEVGRRLRDGLCPQDVGSSNEDVTPMDRQMNTTDKGRGGTELPGSNPLQRVRSSCKFLNVGCSTTSALPRPNSTTSSVKRRCHGHPLVSSLCRDISSQTQ